MLQARWACRRGRCSPLSRISDISATRSKVAGTRACAFSANVPRATGRKSSAKWPARCEGKYGRHKRNNNRTDSMTPLPDTQQLLREANQHVDAGRLPDAERLYRQILSREPNNPFALHGLGIVALKA